MTSITMPLSISGYAASPTGDFIDKGIKKIRDMLQKSNALGIPARVFQQLGNVFEECSSDGWDGEQAKPISGEVVRYAERFLNSLPFGMEAPEVGAEPDGAITLEWYRSPSKVVSISIDDSGWLYFAAIIGNRKRHGADFALLGISDDLLGLISQVAKG
ncbi:MAG: hypothetical protein LLF92_04045 [Planctomycetaceae bacterium]|nr:hypothetical protein [Planctomycetaceae bacterium]